MFQLRCTCTRDWHRTHIPAGSCVVLLSCMSTDAHLPVSPVHSCTVCMQMSWCLCMVRKYDTVCTCRHCCRRQLLSCPSYPYVSCPYTPRALQQTRQHSGLHSSSCLRRYGSCLWFAYDLPGVKRFAMRNHCPPRHRQPGCRPQPSGEWRITACWTNCSHSE